MRQYEMYELCLQGEEPVGSFVKVDVRVVFTHAGQSQEVKGFYAGNGE